VFRPHKGRTSGVLREPLLLQVFVYGAHCTPPNNLKLFKVSSCTCPSKINNIIFSMGDYRIAIIRYEGYRSCPPYHCPILGHHRQREVGEGREGGEGEVLWTGELDKSGHTDVS